MGGLFVKVLKSILALGAVFLLGSAAWASSSDIVAFKKNCEAYIKGDWRQGVTDEGRTLILRKVNPQEAEQYRDCVKSEDGIAIFENNGNKCTTKSCRGIISGKKLLCGGKGTGTNCKAIVLGKPEMCIDVLTEADIVRKDDATASTTTAPKPVSSIVEESVDRFRQRVQDEMLLAQMRNPNTELGRARADLDRIVKQDGAAKVSGHK